MPPHGSKQTFEQEALREQQRLLKRKLEFERRLGQMASKRAAVQAQETASSEHPLEALDDRQIGLEANLWRPKRKTEKDDDAPLIDLNDASIKKLIAQGQAARLHHL